MSLADSREIIFWLSILIASSLSTETFLCSASTRLFSMARRLFSLVRASFWSLSLSTYYWCVFLTLSNSWLNEVIFSWYWVWSLSIVWKSSISAYLWIRKILSCSLLMWALSPFWMASLSSINFLSAAMINSIYEFLAESVVLRLRI